MYMYSTILETLNMSKEEAAMLLTQYEKGGVIDHGDIVDLIVHEGIVDFSLSEYNEYACENGYNDEIYDNDEEFFSAFFTNPMEAVRASYYGEYRFADDFVAFDGYENLKSSDLWEDLASLYDEALRDLIENNIDFDEEDELIEIALNLVKQGY